MQLPRYVHKTAFHSSLPHPGALTFFSVLFSSVFPEPSGGVHIAVLFRLEHSTLSHSEHFDQLRVSTLAIAHWRKELL